MTRTDKPWGHEELFALTPRYAGKLLHIRAGERLSLQYHRAKEETILVSQGRLRLVLAGADGALEEHVLVPGEARHIPPGTRHRMIAEEDCVVFEVSTPELDDVVRLEDAYGRVA